MSLSPSETLVLTIMLKLGKPANLIEISKITRLKRGYVAVLIRRLAAKGYVETKDGSWTITEKAKKVPESQKVDVGKVLDGRYELESLLGKGTYGEVWKAKDKSLERTVAVKLLLGGKKDFQQLKTEGKALSALTHKNILVVHDLGSDEENGWLVTEFVDGPSLHEYLAKKGKEGEWLSTEEAVKIVEQCLEALEYAHEKERVHGDIKPANIFIPKTGEVKLGDFGVAKILSSSREEVGYPPGYHRRLGSSTYLAPEVLDGKPRSFQSDLFSVGILAYILFTGQHPFMHKSGLIPTPELIKSPTYVPPKPSKLKDGVPEKYENIIMRLLAKDVGERYTAARGVLDHWREKIETVQCPKCNAENPIMNKFCGQCGSELGEISQAALVPEKDLSTSYILFTARRSQDAIKVIKRTLDENPDFARGWAHLGYMLNYERLYEEAENACTKSISIDSESSRPYQSRGFARSNLGKFPEAIEDFTIAFEKETDERRKSLILYQRGYTKKLSGDFDGALEDAIEALELDETNTKAQRLKEAVEPLAAIS